MFFKYFIFQIVFFYIISFQYAACDYCELNDVYLHIFGQIENIIQSLHMLNSRMDAISERNSSLQPKTSRSIFDIRFDRLPKHCAANYETPSSCAEATKCTRTSGIYNITDFRYSNQTFMVYCDYEYADGDWLYILTRFNGEENFFRNWNEYVHGFGDVANEYWLGLEKLYALTNYYGPQELNVYIENFEGVAKYARYSHFVIGNASEKYKLKSLGDYSGTAGDSMKFVLGYSFSTYDNDNDVYSYNCAEERVSGFWFKDCSYTNPTGLYRRGKYDGDMNGCFWNTFGDYSYSHKTIIFMIRRKSANKLK